MEFELRAPQLFGSDSVTSWFEQWSRMRNEVELRITFPADGDVRPAGQVLVAACLADRHLRGLVTEIRAHTGPGAVPWEWLHRIAVLRSLAREPGASVSLNEEGDVEEALTALTDLRRAHRLAEWGASGMEKQLPTISPSVVRMARFVFEELGANVVQHSGRAETGFGLVRVEKEGSRLELGFADAGVGLRASLQRNFELAGRLDDDAAALQLALSPRISGAGASRQNMGVGMKLLVDFSDMLKGDLWIASGSAMLQRTSVADQRVNTIRSIPPWQGVWICLDAPLP